MNEFLSADEQDFLQACEVGAIAIVKGLVRDGVNPNANHLKDEDGHSGLDYAGRNGHPELFKYLNELGGGSQSFGQKRKAFQALNGAIRKGHKEIFDYVLDTYPNAETWLKNDALWEASKSNKMDMVQELVARGAEITDQDNAPLRVAATYGNTEIVKYFVENGADVQASDNESIRKAAENKHFNTIKYLIEQGADVQANNNEALIRSSAYGYTEIVKSLLEHGADPHDINGEPILRAARNGHSKVIDVFLDKGIDIFKHDDCPITESIYNKHLQVAENIILTHKIPLSEKSTNQLLDLKINTRADKTISNLVDETLRMNDKLLLNQKLESKLNAEPSFSLSSKPRQGLATKMKSQGMKL